MTRLDKPRSAYSMVPKQSALAQTAEAAGQAKKICLVVSLTCLAGFVIDILAIGLPPSPLSVQWRIGFLQQLGDRSLILFLGLSFLLYSLFPNRRLSKRLSLFCFGIGIAFVLSCLLIIRDTLVLQEQAFRNINVQAGQLQTQIEQEQAAPQAPSSFTPEQFERATQQVNSQAEILKQNARAGITKAGLASIGNLVVVGLGLIGLGRLGLTVGR